MAEAVRQFREAGGSDVVRRLLARPIRLDPPRPPMRLAASGPSAAERDGDAPADAAVAATDFDTRDEEPGDGFEDAGSAIVSEDGEAEPEHDAVVARLQAEMALMKAILMAERAESTALRARIEPEPDALGPEARATRDRWAGMVDRILLAKR
ncbi:hypothetical protein [uncultured Methylobacterium sp.]|uniref:hypothetical protein n=1 Tax=uncultured Methylobacterium sp. TaxID=157278 RepID=UPI0035CA6BBB